MNQSKELTVKNIIVFICLLCINPITRFIININNSNDTTYISFNYNDKTGNKNINWLNNNLSSNSLYTDWQNNKMVDIVVMWGQSNMVGTAAYGKDFGVKDPRTLDSSLYDTKDNKYDNDIIKNYEAINRVNYSIKANTAWEYKYNQDELIDLNNNETNIEYFGEIVKDSNDNVALVASYGTNIIPYFAKTYTEETNHKLVIVHAAYGGRQITCFLPHTDPSYDCNYEGYTYDMLKEKYLAAVKKIEKEGYTIANSFYIVMQGESDSDKTRAPKYYNNYMKVHSYLKKDLKINFGAIIYTSHTIAVRNSSDCKYVDKIHDAQKSIIQKNNDIMLATDWGYKRYTEEYYNAFGPEKNIIKDEQILLSVNDIHFTSASLSKIGVDSALNIAKKIKNPLASTREVGYTKKCKNY